MENMDQIVVLKDLNFNVYLVKKRVFREYFEGKLKVIFIDRQLSFLEK